MTDADSTAPAPEVVADAAPAAPAPEVAPEAVAPSEPAAEPAAPAPEPEVETKEEPEVEETEEEDEDEDDFELEDGQAEFEGRVYDPEGHPSQIPPPLRPLPAGPAPHPRTAVDPES